MDSADPTLTGTLARGAGVSVAGRATGIGLRYLTQLVLARLLGVRAFGLFTLGFGIYQLAELISNMGLQTAAMRFVSVYHGAGDARRLKGVLSQAIGISFCFGAVAGLVLLVAAEPLAVGIYGERELVPILRTFALAVPFGSAMVAAAFASTGFKTTRYLNLALELYHPGLFLLVAAVIAGLGAGVLEISVAWVAVTVGGLLLAISFLARLMPPGGWKNHRAIYETRQLLSFSVPVSLSQFLWLLFLWTDVLMLGHFASPSEAGIYRVASQTALFLVIFRQSLDSIFGPVIADLFGQRRLTDMGDMFRTSVRWSLSLTLPLFLTLAVAGSDVLHVFGTDFTKASLPLLVLAGAQLVNAGSAGVVHMLNMSGRQNLRLAGDATVAIMNVVLNLLWIPRWGMLGAAAASGVSIACVHAFYLIAVRATLGVQPYSWRSLRILAAGVPALLTGVGVHAWLSEPHFLIRLVITGASILAAYALFMWTIGGIDEDDRTLVRRLSRRGVV